MKTNLLILLFTLFGKFAFAQEKAISGTISDVNGVPLPSATVLIKGSTTGTSADFDGKYTINASSGQTLVFSYIGYVTKEVVVGNSNTINVTLEEDAQALDEVVVTGVASGTSRKKLGVAVNSVKAEDLQEAGAQSLDQALQGKIAGTVIQSTSGQPGQQQNIVLRAIGSLNSSQPMILIDGIEVSSTSSSIGGESNLSSRLSDIDFTNVERVETISGAAAGTIYGAQGANGVINIITKKGKVGAPVVSLSSNVGFSSAITGDDMRRSSLHRYTTNAGGFITDLNGTPVTELNANAQYLAVDINERTVGTSQLGAQGINDTPYAEPTFDATDVLFNNAINTRYGVTVSGGSEKIRYLVSGNRTEQESVLIDGKYVKYDARLGLAFDVTDKLKINTRFDVISSSNDTGANTDNSTQSNLISNVFQNLPYVDFFNRNSDGDLTVSPDATDPNSSNPFFFREIQTRIDELSRYIVNLDVTYKPYSFLTLNGKYGYDSYTQNFNSFQENQSSHLQNGSISPNVSGISQHADNQEYFQNLLLSANLILDFENDLKINSPITSTTTLTYDWRDRLLRQVVFTGTNLPEGPFGSFNVNQAGVRAFNSFLEAPFRTYGFLINQKFDYESLAGFSVGIRQDFSNRFGANQDFTFPRADAYFNVAELLDSDIINTFKLRGAYGEAGIQPLFSQNIFTFFTTTVGSAQIASLPSILSNPDLDVEISKELELGIDYRFTPDSDLWFTSFNGSINYFDRKTSGAIFDTEGASSSGSSGAVGNSYDLSSDGIEASLDIGVYNSDKFKWDFGVRYTKSSATLDRIANGLPLVIGDFFTLEQGQEIGTFSVFPVITSLDAVDNSGNRIIPLANIDDFTVASTGYVVNKNTGNVVIGPDKVVAGSSQPDFVLTFINDFSFNDVVSLSVQIDWFQGLDVYNRARQWLYNNGLHADTGVPVTIEDPTGTNQTGAFVSYYTSLYNTNVPTDFFVEDASFARFRDISLRFKLHNLFKIDFVDSFNLTLSGRNLITITDFTGLDPEAARGFGNTFQRGFDEFTHPNTKSYNIGLNMTF